MERANFIMVAIFIALGVVLVGGLVVIPEIGQQSASADNGNHYGSIKNGNNGVKPLACPVC
jgi:hypothetical protein